MSKLAISFFFGVVILLAGCKDEKIDKNAFSMQSNISKEELNKAQNLDKASYAGLEHIFLDTSKISSDGKYIMLIFGKNNCQWCDRLKDDIKEDKSTQEILLKNFNSYYINLSYSKQHHLDFDGKTSTMDSANLSAQYNIRPTPTIVFLDKNGMPIVIYPGYLPQDKFRIFLNFVASGEYKTAKNQMQMHQMLKEKLQGE